MKYIIDRLEEDLAICETEFKKLVSIPKEQLPDGFKEGDVLKENEGTFTIDQEETNGRRQEMKRKLKNLFE